MGQMEDPCDRVKQTARQAGADLVGIASIDRFDHALLEVHPRSIFSHTQSLLRRIVLLLEDQGYTAVLIHNPFHPHTGRPVPPGATSPARTSETTLSTIFSQTQLNWCILKS